MISTKINDPEVSGGVDADTERQEGDVPTVRSWSPISIQRGVLRRR